MTVRVLVVDDEPDLEALIVQKFRREVKDGQLEFLFARDGVEALQIVRERPDLDLVLSDINMPRMDGLKLLEALREQSDLLATVIVSAYGDMANIRIAMNRGAFDFLTKPIDLTDLDATIEKTVRHVVALQESRARQFAAERAHAALSRFFSPNLAERLATEPGAADLSGSRREVAAMFTDIAGFTSLVETLEPDVLAPLLNDYLGEMTDVVFAHGGTLAKIVGDALHVLFGAPADQDDHAARAVTCALALDAHAEAFRLRWREKGLPLGPTRIGVNAGSAIVGNFGGQRYFDYTAYGDSINTAARLETANKHFGTQDLRERERGQQDPRLQGPTHWRSHPARPHRRTARLRAADRRGLSAGRGPRLCVRLRPARGPRSRGDAMFRGAGRFQAGRPPG